MAYAKWERALADQAGVADSKLRTYPAELTDVVDGDTLRVTVDLGFTVRFDTVLRLAALNAPELSTAEGQAAKAWLQRLLGAHGPAVTVQTALDRHGADRLEKWRRVLAVVYVDVEGQQVNVNQALIDAGQAKPWDGKGPRP